MKYLIAFIFTVVFSSLASGSLQLQVSMLDVVKNSDHVITVLIVGVDMVDADGNPITDVEAMTGPGLENTIRLISEVQEVHLTSVTDVPKTLRIPLDSFMHYSLGQIKAAYEGRTSKVVVVLKGSEFKPAFAGVFAYPEVELDTILELFGDKHGVKLTSFRCASIVNLHRR